MKYMQNGVVEYKQKLTNTLLNASSIKDLLANNKNLPHQQFVTKIVGTVMTNEILKKCTIESIMACAIKSAQIGLPVDAAGYAYIVPYKGSCQFQIGVRGYIELAKRNQDVLQITHGAVYDGDDFDYWQDADGFHYKHKMKLNGDFNRECKQGLMCVYTTIKYKSGGSKSTVMDIKSIEHIKSCAQTTYIWDKWYTEKAITACIKRLLKNENLIEIQQALELDDSEKVDIQHQSKTTPIVDIEGEVIFDKPQKTAEQIQQEIDDRNAKNLEEMNTTPLI
jgi:recombination protein RecT